MFSQENIKWNNSSRWVHLCTNEVFPIWKNHAKPQVFPSYNLPIPWQVLTFGEFTTWTNEMFTLVNIEHKLVETIRVAIFLSILIAVTILVLIRFSRINPPAECNFASKLIKVRKGPTALDECIYARMKFFQYGKTVQSYSFPFPITYPSLGKLWHLFFHSLLLFWKSEKR